MYKYFLLFIALLVITIRVGAPSDLHDNDQLRPAEYIQDLLERKHYFYQVDGVNESASKPPLYVWIAALPTKILGYRSDFALKSPSVLSMILLSVLLVAWGKEMKNAAAGYLAATMMWASYHGSKLMYTNRTDMLLAWWIVFSLYCIFKFWTIEGKAKERWLAFAWASMAMGTLTKGPVAVCVPIASWITLMFWTKEWRRIKDIFRLKYILLFLGIVLAWFIPALIIGKEKFYTRVIMHEMVDRIRGTGVRAKEVQPVWFLWPHFIGRFLPWSLLGMASVVLWFRGWKFCENKYFAFLCSWALGGLIFFSLVKGKRADYVFPLEPAAALLAAMAATHAAKNTSRMGDIFRRIEESIIVLLTVVGGLAGVGALIIRSVPQLRSIPVLQKYIYGSAYVWILWGGSSILCVGLFYFLFEKKKSKKKPIATVILAMVVTSCLPIYFFSLSHGAKEGKADIYKEVVWQIERMTATSDIMYGKETPRLLRYFLGERNCTPFNKSVMPNKRFVLILPDGEKPPEQNSHKITMLLHAPYQKGAEDGFKVYLVKPQS